MSEYQYYEFQAIDRRLTPKEMTELRRITSRAEITPTSLINEYHWGDFKGNPAKMMEKYFDLFFYFANWGTRRLMLRLPKNAIEASQFTEFSTSEFLTIEPHKACIVFDFRSEDESGDWEESPGAGSLSRLRDEIMAGDQRALYLGWLCAVSQDYSDVDDDDLEPPVPHGLADLSPALSELADFLRIDPDLIAVSAAWSQPLANQKQDPQALLKWLKSVRQPKKDAWLFRYLQEEHIGLRQEILREFQSCEKAQNPESPDTAPLARRTAGELRRTAEAHYQKRERDRVAEEHAQRLRREQEAAAVQAKRAAALEGKEAVAWKKVESLTASASYDDYDAAVELLKDLKFLAFQNKEVLEFEQRIQDLRKLHPRKRALLGRLKKASLW